MLTLYLFGCIIKSSVEDSHFCGGFFERTVTTMKVTLEQAMLILNYIINHTTDFGDVDIIVQVNGSNYYDTASASYLHGKYGKSRVEYMRQSLRDASKDSKRGIDVLIVNHSHCERSIGFWTSH